MVKKIIKKKKNARKISLKKKVIAKKKKKLLLKKLKNKRIKKIIPIENTIVSVARRAEKTDIKGAVELEVKKAKFSQPHSVLFQKSQPPHPELSDKYDQDMLILQVRDPWWIYAYWELKQATIGRFKNKLKDEFAKATWVLRVYDVSNIIFNGKNAHRYFDICINQHTNNWYIDTAGPGRSWCVDIGLRLPNGNFITMLRSNTVQTPLDGPSWITDEEWMIQEDLFARLYGMGFGLGQSSPTGKMWQEKVKRVIMSRAISSPGISSLASPVKKNTDRK